MMVMMMIRMVLMMIIMDTIIIIIVLTSTEFPCQHLVMIMPMIDIPINMLFIMTNIH